MLDQGTKQAATRALVLPDGILPPDPQRIRSAQSVLIEPWLTLQIAGNEGGAWGLLRALPDATRIPLFVGFGLIAAALVILLYRRIEGHPLLRGGLVLVLGGVLGNLVDRMRYGYVVDFLSVQLGAQQFPTFNVADLALLFGVILVVFDAFQLNRANP